MDIVYALGSRSMWQNNEIKYSLRSVEKFLSNVGKIFIVGNCPDFLTGVIHISHADEHGEAGIKKAENVKNKILRACQEKRLSNEFLFFCDDHFLLQYHDAKSFPFYTMGMLEDRLKRGTPYDNYLKTYRNTIDALKKRGLPLVDFNPHGPIRYKKSEFAQVMDGVNWGIKWGYLMKSLYCNSIQVKPQVIIDDCKISVPMSLEAMLSYLEGKPLFSVGDRAIFIGHKPHQPTAKLFETLYPNKSRWEK